SEDRRRQLAEFDVAQVREDVVPKVRVVDPLCRRSEVHDRALPLRRPGRKGDAAATRVDPQALINGSQLRALVPLGFLPRPERPRSLLAVTPSKPDVIAGVAGLGMPL